MTETAKAPQDDMDDGDEWCDRGCDFHWKVDVSSGSLVILGFKGSCGQAYLSADEAESIANALKDCARVIRKAHRHGWSHVPGISFNMENHDAPRRPRAT